MLEADTVPSARVNRIPDRVRLAFHDDAVFIGAASEDIMIEGEECTMALHSVDSAFDADGLPPFIVVPMEEL